MERLTYRCDGHWCIRGTNGALTSDNHANYWGNAVDRLAYYENMKEQGKLIICDEKVVDKDKFLMQKTINELSKKLNAAESCIYEIEDALNRGSDNDWAQNAIRSYEESKNEEE